MKIDTYQLLNRYIRDFRGLSGRITNTVNARRKRGENTYISKINAPCYGECYVVNSSGTDDFVTLVINYDGLYCFMTGFKDTQSREIDSLNVLTRHFLDQYRNRNNMYAKPNKDVLYDIVRNITGGYVSTTERFDRACDLMNDCVAPIKQYFHKTPNGYFQVDVYVTCLNVQDTKVRELHNAAKVTADKVNTLFGEISYAKKYA